LATQYCAVRARKSSGSLKHWRVEPMKRTEALTLLTARRGLCDRSAERIKQSRVFRIK